MEGDLHVRRNRCLPLHHARPINSRDASARIKDSDTTRLLACLARAQGHPLTRESEYYNRTLLLKPERSCFQNGLRPGSESGWRQENPYVYVSRNAESLSETLVRRPKSASTLLSASEDHSSARLKKCANCGEA